MLAAAYKKVLASYNFGGKIFFGACFLFASTKHLKTNVGIYT